MIFYPATMRSGMCGHGNGRCATGRFFQALGRIHDIELYSNVDNPLAFSSQIYTSHWLHLSVIFLWISGNCFHIGWNGNYELWVTNPVSIMPIAHGIWDPHFSLYLNDVYSSGGSNTAVVISYSGIYNWLYAAGFRCSFQVYHTTIAFEILSVLSLVLGRLHLYFLSDLLVSAFKPRSLNMFTEWRLRLYQTCFDLGGLRLNFHIGALLGVTSVCWSGHLVHVSIPFSQGIHYSLTILPDSIGLYSMLVG
jgi:photosystem I P700 chlorophyll a apoprotein A2